MLDAIQLVETDIWKLQINGPDEKVPEKWPPDPKAKDPAPPPNRWRKPTLLYGGDVLDEDTLITSHGFLNNEIIYLVTPAATGLDARRFCLPTTSAIVASLLC